MATYNIKFTDINKTPIEIDEGDINTQNDIALFGRIKSEYGELLNEDLLHLLENFACPESSLLPGTPDLSVALPNTLNNPPDGQLWFNSTQKTLFLWNGDAWEPLGSNGDYAANSGKILHGQQLPLPISNANIEFTYSECIWIVSPAGIQQSELGINGFSYMVCTTDDNGLVNHQYAMADSNNLVPGVANYLIIGIKNNNNLGINIPPPAPPPINVTPTSTVTPTVTPTPGVSVTPTKTPAPTVTPSVTTSPTRTVTPSPTRAPSVTPSVSRMPPINATLYIDPSVGLANDFGFPASAFTTCNKNASNNCFRSLNVWVANISGGNGGPYAVEYDVTFFYVVNYLFFARNGGGLQSIPSTLTPAFIPPSNAIQNNMFIQRQSSATGSFSGWTANLRAVLQGLNGGPGLAANAGITIQFSTLNETGPNTVGYSVVANILAGSKVTVFDNTYVPASFDQFFNLIPSSGGNPVSFFLPAGSAGQVFGSTILSPPAPINGNIVYTDSYQINA